MITTIAEFRMMRESASNVKVLYLHGLDSSPNKDRVDILLSSGHEIISPFIDYRNENAAEIVSAIIINDNITHIVGHSIGGRLAYHMSTLHGIPALMFNPAFDEEDEAILNLESLDEIEGEKPSIMWTVVGMDDDVVTPDKQIDGAKHSVIYRIDGMGHDVSGEIMNRYFFMFMNTVSSMNEKLRINGTHTIDKSIDEDRTTYSCMIDGEEVGKCVVDEVWDNYNEFEGELTEDQYYELFTGGRVVKLEWLVVKNKYHGRGIASELIKHMLDDIKNIGIKQIYLNASPISGYHGLEIEDLTTLYKKFGFKTIVDHGNNRLMLLNL